MKEKKKINKKKIFILSLLLFVPLIAFGQQNLMYSESQCEIEIDPTQPVEIDIRKFMSCAEERYGVDVNTMRRSNQKLYAPEVDLYFDNTEPKEGQKVTATATPMNFQNSNVNLYYTWFLFHSDDNLDGDNAMEKAKVRAMKITAGGGFDPNLFGITYGSSGDADDDGFNTPYGGADGVGGQECEDCDFDDLAYEQDILTTKQTVDPNDITRCYRHNFGLAYDDDAGEGISQFDSGKDRIIECEHQFVEENDACGGYRVGDGNFPDAEEKCWNLDPTRADTDGDGIPDEADLAGLAQSQFTWDYQPGDRVGVVIEGTSTIPINEDESSGSDDTAAGLTSYYKIMWAGLEICKNKDEDLIEDDECEDEDDFGFTYLATKAVEEEGPQNLETDLKSTPDNPQFDEIDPENSDVITVNAVIKNEAAEGDYVFYDWDIYQCKPDDLENCASTGLHITESCSSGEQLKECAIDDDDEPMLESDSYASGMGINQISFRPLPIIMENNREKEYFKVYLTTKRYEDDDSMSLSNILIPVFKRDFGIRFFEVSPQGEGIFGFSETTDEICNLGIYRQICPVYPNQVIAAKAYSASGFGNNVTFNWKLNGETLKPIMACEMYTGGCELGDLVYFPAIGEDLSLGDISLLVKRDEDEDLSAERTYSVNSPMAVISTDDFAGAWPLIRSDSTEASDVFQTYSQNMVTFRAEMIPDYLEIDKEVSLTWLLDGSEITEEFIEENPDLEISLPEKNKIRFKILGTTGGIKFLTAKVEKILSFDEKYALNKNWGISDVGDLSNEQSVSIRLVYPGDEDLDDQDATASLKVFLASTVKNAPHYFKTIIQLAVLLVIMWSIMFGFSYLINPRKII